MLGSNFFHILIFVRRVFQIFYIRFFSNFCAWSLSTFSVFQPFSRPGQEQLHCNCTNAALSTAEPALHTPSKPSATAVHALLLLLLLSPPPPKFLLTNYGVGIIVKRYYNDFSFGSDLQNECHTKLDQKSIKAFTREQFFSQNANEYFYL